MKKGTSHDQDMPVQSLQVRRQLRLSGNRQTVRLRTILPLRERMQLRDKLPLRAMTAAKVGAMAPAVFPDITD